MHQCADVLALHHPFQVSHDVHIEDIDGQVVFPAHADGGEIHHLQAAFQHLLVGDFGKLAGGGVFLRVGRV